MWWIQCRILKIKVSFGPGFKGITKASEAFTASDEQTTVGSLSDTLCIKSHWVQRENRSLAQQEAAERHQRRSIIRDVTLLLLSWALKGLRGAHLMPPLHGPLPPLKQEALLSVRLLHAGRNPPEPLYNLPAVLEGHTGAILWVRQTFPLKRLTCNTI